MIRPSGSAPARIMIVAEFPSEQDMAKGIPLSGWAGEEFNAMLKDAGISRYSCFVTCVLRERPFANDVGSVIAMKKSDITDRHKLVRDKLCLPAVWEGISILQREIELVQPNVIISLGNLSLWALTGKWGITSWRGSMLQADLQTELAYKPKVLPTYSPNMVMKNWSWRQICVHDLRRAKTMSNTQELVRPDYSFVIRPDLQTVLSIIEQLCQTAERGPIRLGLDIETAKGYIETFGIAWDKRSAICIPFLNPGKWNSYWTAEEEVQIVYALYKLLTRKNVECIGQNFHYDAQYLLRMWHFVPNLVRDTMFSQHSMFSNLQKSLDYQSSLYCEFHEYWKDDGKGCEDSVDADRRWIYNCTDCVVTLEIDENQQPALDKMGLRKVADFQQSLWNPVLKIMNRGVKIDLKKRIEQTMQVMDQIAEKQHKIDTMLGHPLNINSSAQMTKLFYTDLGQQQRKNKKTGSVSCDDEALGKIAESEPILRPLITEIQHLRSLGVFLSTFLLAKLDGDDRMRTMFKVCGTETYRFASTQNAFGGGLNFQNIPKGGGSAGLQLPNVREIFIPDRGMTFFDIDLDSADLRVVAWEADITEMKAMLAEGKKVYVEVMKEYFKNPNMTKHSKEYSMFKSLCHGTHYLGTPRGLADRIGLLVHEVERIQQWYFGKFPQLLKYQSDIKDQVTKRRFVQNVFGHRMYFFDRIEGTIFNQAAAWIPQSTVGCLINHGLVAIDKELPEVQVLLQVHDSLAGQFPTHFGDWMVKKIVKCVEIPLPYDDPLTIPVGVKTSIHSWGDCE